MFIWYTFRIRYIYLYIPKNIYFSQSLETICCWYHQQNRVQNTKEIFVLTTKNISISYKCNKKKNTQTNTKLHTI